MLVAPGGAFVIRGSLAVAIENLAILSLGREPAITVQTALGLALRQLVMAVFRSDDNRGAAIALPGIVAGASISDNAIFAPVGILANDPTAPRAEGDDQTAFLVAAALAIDDNVLWCERQAVGLDGTVLHLLSTRITGNDAIACARGRDERARA